MKSIKAFEITDKKTGKRLDIVRAKTPSQANRIYRSSAVVKSWQPETIRIYKVKLTPIKKGG